MEISKFLALKIQLFAEEPDADNETPSVTPPTEVKTENEGNNNDEDKKIEDEKKFSQKEVDDIVQTRLAKAKKGMPNAEELKEFNEWKDSKKTEAEKLAEKEKEYQKKDIEIADLKQKLVLEKSEVDDKFKEFVKFSVNAMEGDFEDNLEKFLEDNPMYKKTTQEVKKVVSLGSSHTDSTPEDDDAYINQIMGIK